ncbi:putative copper resistance protein D [Bradyrhizobium sp. cir1]|uniref:copper homeostasis membrane protein CopD n=1 Tax=Bradyrhizobium sp. cir1 TaxID=1445730 RepID=UPI001605CB8D|nr:copper homeostasis membrane protein CopD [Bradyrhizobium sp. cir1]MBB4371755.1 putative copper resistance protein D [Bradyrhizobium sp. cir1]
MDTGLVLVRFVHYGASLVLFGLVLFPLYAYPSVAGGAGSSAPAISRSVSLLVLITGIAWFIGVAASMSDAGLSWEAARFIVTETSFGTVSLLRLGAGLAALSILTLRFGLSIKKLDLVLVAVCAILLGSLAAVGHTQVEDGPARAAHSFSDALHLLAAGAWLGGLVGLMRLTFASFYGNEPIGQACEAAYRFSKMGYMAVAILVASGLFNSWFLVGSLTNLVATAYGRLLLLKLVLFAAMVGFAGLNRFLVVPTLLRSAAGASKHGLRRLLINMVAELSLGSAIVLIVSVLGTTEPAGAS